MMTAFIFSLALLCVSNFVLKVIPRLGSPLYGTDSWYYLLAAETFKEKREFPIKLNNYLLDIEEQNYPPLFTLFLSFFPKKILKKQYIVSPLVDVIQVSFLFIFSYYLTGNLWVAVLAGMLYSIIPNNIAEFTNLNSRSLASVWFSASTVCIILFSTSFNYVFLIFGISFGILLLLTHKLATQGLVFLLLLFSFYEWNYAYSLILVSIFLLTIVLTKGYYIKILRGHYEIVKFWSNNLTFLHKHQVYSSPIFTGKTSVSTNNASKNRTNDSASKMKERLLKHRFSSALMFLYLIIGRNPLNLYLFFPFFIGTVNGVQNHLWLWGIGLLFFAVVTTYVPMVKYFGEGYKYLIYGSFPVSFIAAYYSILSSSYFYLLISLIGLCVYRVLRIYVRIRKRRIMAFGKMITLNNGLMKIYDYLRSSSRDNIMCIPVDLADPAAYFTRKKVLWGAHSGGYDKLIEFFPIIRIPLDVIIKKYDISYFLVDIDYIDPELLNISNKKLVIKEDNLLLYEIEKPRVRID